MRYEVLDETNSVLRRFATKHEAEYFKKVDKELWIRVLPKPKNDTYGTALTVLGLALL
jgi:hypothetical protein